MKQHLQQQIARIREADAQDRQIALLEDLLYSVTEYTVWENGDSRIVRQSTEDYGYEVDISLIAQCGIPDLEALLFVILQRDQKSREKQPSCDNGDPAGKDDPRKRAVQIAFSAYYTLHVMLRRKWDYDRLAQLDRQYSGLFKGVFPIAGHLSVLTKLNVRKGSYAITEKTIQQAKENCARFPLHAGVQHGLADLVITVLELYQSGQQWSGYEEDGYAALVSRWLDDADAAVSRAIELQPDYAKFYATKARVLSKQNRFEEALALIDEAKRCEDKKMSHYANRMTQYEQYRIQIELDHCRHFVAPMHREQGSFEKKMERILQKNMEQVTWLLTLALIGLSLASHFTAYDLGNAALAGGIICLFGGIALCFSLYSIFGICRLYCRKTGEVQALQKSLLKHLFLYLLVLLSGLAALYTGCCIR